MSGLCTVTNPVPTDLVGSCVERCGGKPSHVGKNFVRLFRILALRCRL